MAEAPQNRLGRKRGRIAAGEPRFVGRRPFPGEPILLLGQLALDTLFPFRIIGYLDETAVLPLRLFTPPVRGAREPWEIGAGFLQLRSGTMRTRGI